MTKKNDVEAQIRAIWARLPTIDCQGMCWDSCTAIMMTGPEHRMVERAGTPIPDRSRDNGNALCPALDMLHRCSVHEARPTICRLWGLTEGMRCNYGCVPEGGHLTDQQGFLVAADVLELGGEHAAARQLRFLWNDDNAPTSRRLLLERTRQAETERLRLLARREAAGTARYAIGRGRISKSPPGGKPK